MDFFTNAIDVLQTLVIALGGGLCVWGGINLLEGYGQDNPASKASGMTAVVLALLVGLYFLISGLQHKSATIHCQKIAQTPPPKQDFVGRGRSFYSFIYGNTAQFPPSGLSTASAAAALRIMRYCLISCPIGT